MRQSDNEVKTIIQDWIKKQVDNARVALPGVITGYDAGSNRASVKPSGSYKAKDGRALPYPVIYNVPVVFPTGNGGSAGVTFPISSGDGCLIVFSDESISGYLAGNATNEDPRRHSMNDAIAIPGLYPGGATAAASNSGETCLTCGGSKLRLSSGGLIVELADGTSVSMSGGDLVVNGVSSVHHTHMGVHGETSPPL